MSESDAMLGVHHAHLSDVFLMVATMGLVIPGHLTLPFNRWTAACNKQLLISVGQCRYFKLTFRHFNEGTPERHVRWT